MWDYSKKVKEHFFNPRNANLVSDANAKGDVGSLSCGDALSLTLKIDPETEMIEDAGFQTFGCGSAIASSSALTEIIIGKTVSEALAVTNNDIAEYLDGLPPEKMHCSVMGMEALHAAVANYRGEKQAEAHEEGELICKCFAIDDLMIKRVVAANGLTTLEDVVNYTKAGGACTSCHEKIEWVLEECLQEASQDTDVEAKGTDASEDDVRIAIIEEVIAKMRPNILADGGDIELVDVEDDMVFVSMTGNCMSCGLSGLTISNLETKLSAALNMAVTVFPVTASDMKKEATHNA